MIGRIIMREMARLASALFLKLSYPAGFSRIASPYNFRTVELYYGTTLVSI
jgi:hypothetical protein